MLNRATPCAPSPNENPVLTVVEASPSSALAAATVGAAATDSPAQTTTAQFHWSPALVTVAVLVFLGHLPLLVAHAYNLWDKPHYQFFPLALAGAIVLSYRRLREPGAFAPGNATRCWVLAGMAWSLLAAATALASPWLGAVAALVTLAAAAYWIGGRALVRRLLPVGCFLWLLVPPPLGWDQQLISGMQTLTSQTTGRVLDYLHVPHRLAGNTIVLVGHELFVEEACSGIQSLFAVLCYTGIFLLWINASWGRCLFLGLAAVGWVLAANLIRMVGVVYCLNHWGLDLTQGWRHEAFGAVLFALIVALTFDTDQLWLYFTSTPPPRPRRRQPYQEGVGVRATDLIPACPPHPQPLSPRPEASARDADTAGGGRGEPGAHQEISQTVSCTNVPPEQQARRPATTSQPALGVLAVAFGCLGLAQFAWFLPAIREAYVSRHILWPTLDALTADSLPEQWQGWQRAGFEVAKRGPNRFFGDVSRKWMYRNPTLRAVVSVDYPFSGWHDLTVCYRGAGWFVQPTKNLSPGSGLFVPLEKSVLERGFLWFNLLDRNGQSLAPEADTTQERFAARPAQWRRRLAGQAALRDDRPSFQVQVLLEHPIALSSAEREQGEALFAHVCDLVVRSLRAAAEGQP